MLLVITLCINKNLAFLPPFFNIDLSHQSFLTFFYLSVLFIGYGIICFRQTGSLNVIAIIILDRSHFLICLSYSAHSSKLYNISFIYYELL